MRGFYDLLALLLLSLPLLLLALLCLVYEERGEFPPNRDEIYDEATRALLVKWDSSRNIERDVVYKELSPKHKQKMLARIAAETFAESEYFLPEKRVVGLIDAYLQGVPGLEERRTRGRNFNGIYRSTPWRFRRFGVFAANCL